MGFPENGIGYVDWVSQCFVYGIFHSFTTRNSKGDPLEGIVVMQRCRL
jgi:hypothetical protein